MAASLVEQTGGAMAEVEAEQEAEEELWVEVVA